MREELPKQPLFPKVVEYLARIRDGEPVETILPGLPASWQEQIRSELGMEKTEETQELLKLEQESIGTMNAGELQDFIDREVPVQYRGFDAETLEIVWSPKDVRYYTEEGRREAEVLKRERVFAAYDLLAEKVKENIHQTRQRSGDAEKRREVERSLGIAPAGAEQTEVSLTSLASLSLNQDSTHKIESQEKGITVVFDNTAHGQDAFAIEGDSFVVCDGASSYGRSGIVSRMLSEKVAKRMGSGEPMMEVLKQESMQKMIEEIKDSPEFVQDQLIEESKRTAGLCTLLTAQFNRTDNSIEFASIGDSPLLVIDTNPDGTTSFQIVNDEVNGKVINGSNFTDADIAEDMKNPATYLVGVGKSGNVRLDDMPTMRRGKVTYRPHRKVILASDFLTKMMIMSPQMFDAKSKRYATEGRVEVSNKFAEVSERIKAKGSKLSGDTFDPLVFSNPSLTEDVLKELIREWKEDPAHNSGVDDMTAITLDMDKLVANK